jgi:hypothetical protein
MKKKIKILFAAIILSIIMLPIIARGADSLAGKILLQVESRGQTWYVNPADKCRYFLGTPKYAFKVMKMLGLGISNNDLQKIPIGFLSADCDDNDNDGACNNLEDAIGSDKNNKDTDYDGYDDKTELDNGYDPLAAGKKITDKNFTVKNSGKIFLQVEKNGEAWYVEPVSQKRYYLGRPLEAYEVMKKFGLGITNSGLEKISIGKFPITNIFPNPIAPVATSTENVIYSAAAAIRESDAQKIKKYFSLNMHKSIEYSMKYMSKESLLLLANILSGSTMISNVNDKKIYTNEVYFQDKKHTVYFYVEKQADGTWKMTNL